MTLLTLILNFFAFRECVCSLSKQQMYTRKMDGRSIARRSFTRWLACIQTQTHKHTHHTKENGNFCCNGSEMETLKPNELAIKCLRASVSVFVYGHLNAFGRQFKVKAFHLHTHTYSHHTHTSTPITLISK